MIARLHGRLESLGSDWAVINVGGIGFQVHMSTSTLSILGNVGIEVHLYTHLHLREDNVTLYGFLAAEEQQLFEMLLTVSGVGPKIALAMLSTMSVEQASTAIATGNVELLTVVPGIGKKTAQRLILELKDKISAGLVATPAGQLVQENTDVLSALTTLGYSVAEATQAITSLPLASDLSLEEKIKRALQYFGRK
ncbi:MAG: Holliday junction helicase subunit RuvA [Dehalococcoidales bacterium]|nr:Holliday junction helicase subunit RuvA [Dehalococcoidales bacterium]